jgi:hypothetical protein
MCPDPESLFRVTFRMWHPDIDPSMVSARLSLTPTRSWRVGESRKNPDGHLLGGQYDRTYWAATVERSAGDSDLESQLTTFLQRLDSHADFLHDIRRSGGEIEFFITLKERGSTLSYVCLRRLADLNIDLSIDV